MQSPGYWPYLQRRRISRRALIKGAGIAAAGAAGAALVGCGGEEEAGVPAARTALPEGTPQPGGTMRVGLPSDPGGLDPQLSVTSYWAGARIHGYLFMVSLKDQSMLMELAESFEQPDETTYVWKLKPGVRFQNIDPTWGREVTAEDVVYSMERRRDEPTSQNDKQLLRDFTASFEATDQYTFRFRTNRPYSPTLDEIGNPSYAIVPREAVEKWGNLHLNAAGCGGYILKEFVKAERVEMVRNPDFFMSGRPYLEGMEFLVIPDQSSLLEAFKTKRLDYNGATLDKIKVDDLRGIEGIVVIEAPNFWNPTLLLRVDRPPFNDIRVREALDLALDRQDLIDRMFFGDAMLNGPIVWGLDYWALPQEELRDFYKYDPQEAKQLLSAAGYEDGLDVETTIEDVVYMSQMATVVKEHFARVGVRCNLKPQELGVYLAQTLYPGDFEMTWYYNLPYVEPDRPLCQYFSKGQAGITFSGYDNPKMDEWIWKERSEFDREKRRQIILDAQRAMLLEHGPQINTCTPRGYVAFWEWVKGVDANIGAWGWLGLDTWMTKRT